MCRFIVRPMRSSFEIARFVLPFSLIVLRGFKRAWVDAGRGKPRPYKVEELIVRRMFTR